MEVTTRFFRVSNKPLNENRRPIRNFFHQSRLGRQGKDAALEADGCALSQLSTTSEAT